MRALARYVGICACARCRAHLCDSKAPWAELCLAKRPSPCVAPSAPLIRPPFADLVIYSSAGSETRVCLDHGVSVEGPDLDTVAVLRYYVERGKTRFTVVAKRTRSASIDELSCEERYQRNKSNMSHCSTSYVQYAADWRDLDGQGSHFPLLRRRRVSEEREERVWLSFESCRSQVERSACLLKLKNVLFDRAWNMCHRNRGIAVQKLLEVVSSGGARAAKQLVVSVGRKSIGKAAPPQKHKAFSDFFRRGHRRRNENINDFIMRGPNEYERRRDLTNNKTQVSDDLRAFFLF